jgi:hypothetical protein
MSLYDFFDTVDFDFGRLFPARLRRLIFSTSEFFRFFAMKLSKVSFFNAASRAVVAVGFTSS